MPFIYFKISVKIIDKYERLRKDYDSKFNWIHVDGKKTRINEWCIAVIFVQPKTDYLI